MTVEISFATEQDKSSWNQYVLSHPEASPYHNFAWVQSVEKAYKHRNISLIAKEKDTIVGVLPLVRMKGLSGKAYACSLPFCDLGHIVSSSEEAKQALLERALSLKSEEGLKDVDLRGSQQDIVDESVNESDLVGKKVRMLLPLPATSDELMQSFKSKLRSQVRKAEKNGLTAITGKSPEMIDEFYAVIAENMRKLGSPVHSKDWFVQVLEQYGDNICVGLVKKDGITVGAGILLFTDSKVAIPWASTVAQYNKLAPNMLLYWSLLSFACDKGLQEFDFGRSTYAEGTFKFKKQWGAKPCLLDWQNQGEDKVDATSSGGKLRPAIENIWSKLPLGITTTVGPMIRKYISL